MTFCLALIEDADAPVRQGLVRALRPHLRISPKRSIQFCESWSELVKMASIRPAKLIVFSYNGSADAQTPLPRLRHRSPHAGLVAVLSAETKVGKLAALFDDAVEVDAIVVAEGTRNALDTELEQAVRKALANRLIARLRPELEVAMPTGFCAFILRLIDGAFVPLDADDAVRMYGAGEKLLRRDLREVGLPPIGQLITWCRLFQASFLLEEPGKTIEKVALGLEFPSANAFRNQLRRYAGIAPSELRGPAAVDTLLGIFLDRHHSGDWVLR